MKITFTDYIYQKAFVAFNHQYGKTFTNIYKNYGPHRFTAAFEDTYEKVCLIDDGDLYDGLIQKKFVYRFRDRLKDYGIKCVVNRLSSLTIYAANKFGGQYTDQINDLLQKYHVELVRKGYGERKILKELQKVQDSIDTTESFEEWSGNPILLAA